MSTTTRTGSAERELPATSHASPTMLTFGRCDFRTLPDDLWHHHAADGRTFYTLPKGLLDGVLKAVGDHRFDAGLLAVERRMAGFVRPSASEVGVRDGVPIQHHLLEVLPSVAGLVDLMQVTDWGRSAAHCKQIARMADERLDHCRGPLQGYLGWLLSNREFVGEHDGLLATHRDRVRRHGFPKFVPGCADSVLGRRVAGDEAEWIADYRAFCDRWRLQELTGPGLPLPVGPQIPQLLPAAAGAAGDDGRTSFLVPDIFPVRGEGVLHEMLDDALHAGRPPGHLAEWLRIVGRANTAKNAIARYARLFRLQHWWRALFARHASALHRTRKKLVGVFADFLQVSDDTVKRDLRFLDGRLGKNWETRPDPLD